MLPFLLNFFPGVDFKRVTIITLTAGCGILYAYVHEQNVELAQARLIYSNPRVVTKIQTRTEYGPVRIVTRIIERPSGDRETTIDETRGAIIETKNGSRETAPVSLASVLTPARTDRYLLSIGSNKLNADIEGKALFAGYGFKNRLDVQLGFVDTDRDNWKGVLVTARF